jgi:ATP-dependent RNA circularization protein (DNA/RNA ligase family)
MFKRFFKTEQQKLIEFAVTILEDKENNEVRANAAGFDKPQKVKRVSTNEFYFPDITAKKSNQFRIFSVETKQTLHDRETLKRWKLFSEFAKQNNALFFIAFPVGSTADIKKTLQESEIEAQLWELTKK